VRVAAPSAPARSRRSSSSSRRALWVRLGCCPRSPAATSVVAGLFGVPWPGRTGEGSPQPFRGSPQRGWGSPATIPMVATTVEWSPYNGSEGRHNGGGVRYNGSDGHHTLCCFRATSGTGVLSQMRLLRPLGSGQRDRRHAGRATPSGRGMWSAGLAVQCPASPPAMTILRLRWRFSLILAITAGGFASSFQSNRITV
jgi:hypothetical protein